MDSWVFAEENLQLLNSIIEKSQQVSENVIKSDLHTLFCNNLNLEGNINDTIIETKSIVNISSDEEESVELICTQEHMDVETNIDVSDDLKLLLDNFQNTGWQLSNDEFLQIMNSEKLENVFKFLETHLSSEGLHKFCLYLTSLKNIKEIENIIKVFCTELLYPKFISSPINTSLEIGVIEIFKTYENICVNLIERLIVEENPNLRIVIVLCDKLSFNNKLTILSKLLSSCEKLDEDRIELFQTLYVSDADYNLKQRMINLLYDTANTYSMSKLYGKLMITVFKSLGSEFSEMKNSLNYIVQENKSIYKRAAEKMLQNMF